MAGLVPEDATRLQAAAFVHGAELAAVGRDGVIRAAAEKLAESALRKILSDCIKTEGDYQGYPGQTLVLDVYVLARLMSYTGCLPKLVKQENVTQCTGVSLKPNAIIYT